MRLVRYGAKGAERPGLLDADDRVRDLSGHVADIDGACLTRDGLARLRSLDPAALPLVDGVPQQDLRLGACVAGVGKFLAVGLNYADHAAEAGMDVPVEPILFTKWTSCIAGPDDDLGLPTGSSATDWEVELGIVIGDGGHGIALDRAADHIAGYCVINDISERDWQLRRGGTWDKGKGHDGFGPIGPWLVTADAIPDPAALRLWLEVDGRRFQDGTTATMVFGPAEIVSYASRFTTLHPGDVIATGTPPGVGMGQKPPVYLTRGQVMRLGIDGLGQQRQKVV
ncbi:FAA hydrolase family protein [Paracoccus sediminis]|uniref:2,4-diketo-3-deoxy-L-fuconate hydrolase n=1 Tax=Paracoccus sediminis TaxID=1214787 RepID=A0A238UYW6_9RHOB|nr:fumarylacetoacetate hydrolase family protein [Paracoccus sediminis]TBN52647.1 FAA hydrolase family protein [Paracoccus sediminis]SNR26974.1 2,4-diketo-3-deoxy-L-fuconate hydrolase [Paracoccus sediminis]